MGLPAGCMTPPGGGCLAGDPNCGGTPCHPISSCISKPDPLSCARPSSGGALTIDAKGNTVNSLLDGSPPLQALLASLHNLGINVTVQLAQLSGNIVGEAQMTSASSGVLFFDPSKLPTAEADGQDPAQLVYHEADHLYYWSLPGFLTGMPNSATFTITGTTYVYNTANLRTNTANVMTISPGEQGWEHMLIDTDIKNAFGTDTTSAASSGLTAATNAPSPANLASTLIAIQNKKSVSSRAITQPKVSTTCVGKNGSPSSQTSMSVVIENGITYIDPGFSETY